MSRTRNKVMPNNTIQRKKPALRASKFELYSLPLVQAVYVTNSTNEYITIVQRNNIPITYPPNSGGFQGENVLSVKMFYRFRSRDIAISTLNNIHRHMEKYKQDQYELREIRDRLLLAVNDHELNQYNTVIEFILEYNYELKELQEAGRIYCPSTDYVIGLGAYHSEWLHPDSSEGKAFSDYFETAKVKHISGIFVEIIDNDDTLQDRYMYAGKQIMKVMPTKDRDRPSGVYYTIANHDRLDNIHIEPHYFSFDEAESHIGLYKTQEQALSGGNPELLVKTRLVQMESDTQVFKAENLKLKEEFNNRELAHKSELANIQARLDLLKGETDRAKAETERQLEDKRRENAVLMEQLKARSAVRSDYYEERSVSRKDDSELWKYLPMVAVGIAAVATALLRNK